MYQFKTVQDQTKNKLQNALKTMYDSLYIGANSLHEHDAEIDDKQKTELKNVMKKCMLDCIKADTNQTSLFEACDEFSQCRDNIQNSENQDYANVLNNLIFKYKQPSDSDAEANEKYIKLLRTISPEDEKLYAGEELMQTQVIRSTICPFSQKQMQDPVINELCNHTYEREPILQYIKTQKQKAKCPVASCQNQFPLKESHLKSDTEMLKILKEKQFKKKNNSFVELNDSISKDPKK